MENKYDYYYEMKCKKQKYNKIKIDWDLMILKAFFLLAVVSFIAFSFVSFLANRG